MNTISHNTTQHIERNPHFFLKNIIGSKTTDLLDNCVYKYGIKPRTTSTRKISKAIQPNTYQATALKKRTLFFLKRYGRRPRMLLARLDQDEHNRSQHMIASRLSNFGFDIDIAPPFLNPKQAAKIAIENDTHCIGISSLAKENKHLLFSLVQELTLLGGKEIVVFANSVISNNENSFSHANVFSLFCSRDSISFSAQKILTLLEKKITSSTLDFTHQA